MYNFKTVIGTQSEKPKEIDTESSQYYIYIRKDIVEENITDEEGNEVKGWKYKECQVPNNNYLIDQLGSHQESIDAIMLAIADLYEKENSNG